MGTKTDHGSRPYNISGHFVTYENSHITSQGDTSVFKGTDYTYLNTFTGVDNPSWRSQIAKGVAATTPATGDRDSFSSDYLDIYYDHEDRLNASPFTRFRQEIWLSGYPRSNGLLMNAPFSVPASVSTAVNNRAISKFIEACKSAASSFESGQDLGEWKQTLNGVLHPMKSLRQHVLSYFPGLQKRRRGRHTRNSLRKALSDSYLEWTFGWKPLAMDVADGIAKLGSSRFDVVPITEGASDVHSGGNVRTLNGYGTSLPLWWTYQVYSKYAVRYKGGYRTEAGKDGKISKYQDLQLLPRDWAPTAWDLLPYSFIADYFANIGDIVNAFCFARGNVAWLNRTVRDEAHQNMSPALEKYLPPGGTSVTKDYKACSGGNLRRKRVGFIRSNADPSFLSPEFQLRLPTSEKPWENMLALMLSRAKPLTPFFK